MSVRTKYMNDILKHDLPHSPFRSQGALSPTVPRDVNEDESWCTAGALEVGGPRVRMLEGGWGKGGEDGRTEYQQVNRSVTLYYWR